MDENKRIKFYTKLVQLNVIFRLFFGPTIFFFPHITAIAAFFLDWIDGELFKRAGYERKQYSFYDKILDYYWYVWIVLYVAQTGFVLKELLLFLFVYRSIGQFLYLKFKKGIILFMFPNIFEILFLVLLFVNPLQKWYVVSHITETLSLITIFVLIREYVLHIHLANLSGMFTGKTTLWPNITLNPYKALIFATLTIAATASFFPMYQNMSTQTRAQNQKYGTIITFSRQTPELIGVFDKDVFINKPNHISIIQNNEVVCSGIILPTEAHTPQNTKKQYLFSYKDPCIQSIAPNTNTQIEIADPKNNISLVFDFITSK